MTRHDRRIIGFFTTAHTLVHILEMAFPALFLLLQAEFELSLEQGGLIVTGFAVAFGAGAVPAGILATRFGAKRVVQLYLVLAGIGSLIVALAESVTMLTIGTVGIGIGVSLYHPAGTSFLATQVAARAKAMGYHGLGGGLGIAIGTTLAVVLAQLLTWRGVFAVYTVAAYALAYALRYVPEDRRILDAGEDGSQADIPIQTTTQTPQLVTLLFAGTLIGFVYRGIMTFLPMFIGISLVGSGTENITRATQVGGALTTGVLFVGMFAQWLSGQLGSRFSSTFLFAAGHTFSVPCLLALTVLNGPALIIAASLFAFGHFLAQPMGNVLVADYTSESHRNNAFGWYFALAFGIGSLGAYIGGGIGDRFSLEAIFVMLAGVAAVAVGASWWMHFLPAAAPAPTPQVAEA